MELLLTGASLKTVAEVLKLERLPQPLMTYLFCCPSLDGQLRCLPKLGGYLDQDYWDILCFNIIEQRIRMYQHRQMLKSKSRKKK